MPLLDILACPRCRGIVAGDGDGLACTACHARYPRVSGVPVMLAGSQDAGTANEGALGERPGYGRWKERLIIKSLPEQYAILDFGAGNQALDDPCIVRMDLAPSRFVDLAGDVTNLPFRDESIGFAFGGAVMEHVSDPAAAIRDLFRVLRPGGYVYVDWASTFAYHGYPHHYFNAQLHGIRNAFREFTILEAGVAPYHGASPALRSVIGTYLEHFEPRTLREHWFAADLDALFWRQLDRFDRCFAPGNRFRVAAAVYVLAVKQPSGRETLIPPAIMEAYAESPELQRRFPEPLNLGLPDNLMQWARREGARNHDLIRRALAVQPFTKHADGSRPQRYGVDSWPLELMTEVDPLPTTTKRLGRLFGRDFTVTIPYGRFHRGPIGVVRRRGGAIWRWMRGRISRRAAAAGRRRAP